MWRFPSWDGARKRSWLTLGGALPSLNSQQPLSRPSGCALQSPSACEVPVVVPLDRGARTAASRPGAELHRGRWGALPARVRSCTKAAGGRYLPGCGAARELTAAWRWLARRLHEGGPCRRCSETMSGVTEPPTWTRLWLSFVPAHVLRGSQNH